MIKMLILAGFVLLTGGGVALAQPDPLRYYHAVNRHGNSSFPSVACWAGARGSAGSYFALETEP